jgi:anhydro-N-acetylmuramic acid kinase
MTSRWIIGLASGSSGDGIDSALLELSGVGLEIRIRQVQGLHQPYNPDLRELIRRVSGAGSCESRLVSRLHRLLGETNACAARAIADQASLDLSRVQCIGCPGHSVWHDPEGRFPSTLGLGMAGVVAERCGITTVSDFRDRDLAAGGQGVPLAALADYILFRHPEESRVLLHLGGVSRVVFLPAGCRIHEVVGFEAGPCNGLLDALMHHLTGGREPYDAGGKHAVQGKCIEPLLETWLAHPYLQRRPPKSLPSHLFAGPFAAQAVQQVRQTNGSLHDLLCTSTHFVARGITSAIQRFLPPRIDRVFLSGGGMRNGLLWHLLEQQLGRVVLARSDEAGIPADLRKAIGFGILAALTLDGIPGNVPSATGAAGSRLLGSLTPGSSASWARCLAWMAGQMAPAGKFVSASSEQ